MLIIVAVGQGKLKTENVQLGNVTSKQACFIFNLFFFDTRFTKRYRNLCKASAIRLRCVFSSVPNHHCRILKISRLPLTK